MENIVKGGAEVRKTAIVPRNTIECIATVERQKTISVNITS